MDVTPVISGPHTHIGNNVSKDMYWVMLALTPVTVYGVYLFGWPALNLLIITLLAVVVFEALSLRIAGKPLRPTLLDGSALLTGLILALSLPPWAPWWVGVLGAAFAIIIGKHIFGGLGQNLFNPAMLARVVLLISFPLEMTTWIMPQPLFTESAPGFLEGLAITFGFAAIPDALTGATVLDYAQTAAMQDLGVTQAIAGHYAPLTGLLGYQAGSMGETSALLLLLGGALLLFKRVIRWEIPLAMLATLAILATFFMWLDPQRHAGPGFHLLSGGVMLVAFFIATDPVTSPSSRLGRILFGAGCGVLDYIIRIWGNYPEGIAFAVLLMNALTPLIDHYVRPRIYGRNVRGSPLSYRPPKSEQPKAARKAFYKRRKR